MAAGDLGLWRQRKFDCEAWIPTQGKYRELTSTSNCTQFQARRLDIRMRAGNEATEPVATLNGTLMASARTIVAMLETHQQADGSVRVPEVLGPTSKGVRRWIPRVTSSPAAPAGVAADGRARHRRHLSWVDWRSREQMSPAVRKGGRAGCRAAGTHVVLVDRALRLRDQPVIATLGLEARATAWPATAR